MSEVLIPKYPSNAGLFSSSAVAFSFSFPCLGPLTNTDSQVLTASTGWEAEVPGGHRQEEN